MAHALYTKVVTLTAPTPPAIYLRSSTGCLSSMVALYPLSLVRFPEVLRCLRALYVANIDPPLAIRFGMAQAFIDTLTAWRAKCYQALSLAKHFLKAPNNV